MDSSDVVSLETENSSDNTEKTIKSVTSQSPTSLTNTEDLNNGDIKDGLPLNLDDSDNNKDSEQTVSEKSDVEKNLVPTLEPEETMDVDKPPDGELSSEQPEVVQADPDQSNQPCQINCETMDVDEPPEKDQSAAVTEEPSAAVTEEPSAAVTEEPSAAVTEEPSATVTEEPSAAVTEEQSAAVTEEQSEINAGQSEITPEQAETNIEQPEEDAELSEVNAQQSAELISDELKTSEGSNDANDEERSTENTTKTFMDKEGILTSETTQSSNESTEKEDGNGKTAETSDKPVENGKELSSIIDEDHDNFDGERENPVFVHVNTEKDESFKSSNNNDLQVNVDEEDYNCQPQEDPIGSDAEPDIVEAMDDDSKDIDDAEQGADEELCIIPDTERVISQEEKDAAAAMAPIRDPIVSQQCNDAIITASVVPGVVDDVLTGGEVKYIITTCTDENVNTCIQCCLPRKSKYTTTKDDKSIFICDDNCIKAFKEANSDKLVINSEGDLRVKCFISGPDTDHMKATVNYIRKCMDCYKKIEGTEKNLSWETMEFCNEFCLSKHQKKIGSTCANCQVEVRSNCLGKYCVRFGYDIRQFCSSSCLEEYKKGLKVCSYCQKDMSGGAEGFLAPIGDKGQFKDFCSKDCLEKYDSRKPAPKLGLTCSVCLHKKEIVIEFEHNSKLNYFCGEPCFVAFKFVNNITPGKCYKCSKYVDNKILEGNTMFYDGEQHSFCSKSCQNIYIITNRKIVPCSWCKVKKYNFDMIKRTCGNGQILMMCSLNCLSLYQVSINAVHSKKVKCDNCLKNLQPYYHLTMSDATIRNFCSYSCVMTFQNQFAKSPITISEVVDASLPVPTGAPKRSRRPARKIPAQPPPPTVPTIPIISHVQSLATTNGPSNHKLRVSRNALSSNSLPPPPALTTAKMQIKQQIIVKPAPIPPQRNMATMCKVITNSRGINCKPTVANKEVQTDEIKDKTIVIPIPVPIYVPAPMHMYTSPFPMPVPFPLPIPVPIFIPTTRNSASGIMKEIKKIQVKIPTDPFEAELLMMAEMVAGDKKEDNTDSESEEEDNSAPPAEEGFSPEPVDASNSFGDDMLQMALKMATELEEPAVDLEGALTASTITASQGGENAGNEEAVDDPQPIHLIERQSIRGRKRTVRQTRQNTASKRGRRMSHQVDIPMMAPPQPAQPPEPVEKPDANMCLKYTFGVNAWKQWVTTKNAELEKSSRRVKLFKPEILQLTADELNYSLCLFVKEVRKPNGQEYAPDTIYYLCLGIQQYLFENGRIDNIFCDTYYEKFTDCLDEVARKFSVLYNDSHYIVTRVEEEHLWESKQLGAHSPHVLLSTLMFFNTKHFNLTTVDEHMQLSFSHIMKHWKRNPNQPGTNKVPGSRNVLLRFYPPQTALEANTRKKKVYEQQENEENPLRCPVKLYEFYLSKCPESVKTRNDVFYLQPERSCVPDSPVWYSTMPLPREALEKMLHRVKMVKEINVALLTS